MTNSGLALNCAQYVLLASARMCSLRARACRGEIAELNETFGAGATPAMLSHLDELLKVRLVEVAERIEDLHALQTDLQSYLDRIRDKSGPRSASEQTS